jgi:anti-sigma factor RsiW
MNCPSKTRNGRLRLIEFATGRARAMERMELQFHADSCPACRSLIAEQRQVFAALDGWDAVSPSRDFNRTLYARFELEANRSWLRRLLQVFEPPTWIGRPSYPLAIAALLAVIFFAGDASRLITRWRGFVPAITAPATAPAKVQDPTAQLIQALDDLQLLDQIDPVKHRVHHSRTRPL